MRTEAAREEKEEALRSCAGRFGRHGTAAESVCLKGDMAMGQNPNRTPVNIPLK